jgi:hypothetical protein
LEALINEKQACKLLRIDIDKWSSAVARQYAIRSLPTVWLYDGTTRITTNTGDALSRVNQLN